MQWAVPVCVPGRDRYQVEMVTVCNNPSVAQSVPETRGVLPGNRNHRSTVFLKWELTGNRDKDGWG